MLHFRYRGNQASSVVDICMKCSSSGWKSIIIPLSISIALPRWKRIGHVRFLLLLPLLVFLLWGVHIFWYTWYPRMSPDAENERGTVLLLLPSLTTNNVSAISQMCLSFTHQWWQATMTVHISCPCDTTIENEFPESDASLGFEMLHFDAELERTHN